MSFSNNHHEVNELIELAIDGTLTEEQARLLNEWLCNNKTACRYYCEYMHLTDSVEILTSGVSSAELLGAGNFSDCQSLYQDISSERLPGSRWYLNKAVLSSLAAMMLFAISLCFIWLKPDPVASISNSISASWEKGSGYSIPSGNISAGNRSYSLKNGYVELLFNDQTRVVLEAPTRFKVIADNKIMLSEGKVYAAISQANSDFTISTELATVVDLGTEFGVIASQGGSTAVHVTKGSVQILAGDKLYNKKLNINQAREITSEKVSDIEYQNNLFVRKINQNTGMIWRGQSTVSLADMVGGGSGFGDGKSDDGYDPCSGKNACDFLWRRKSSNDYRKISINQFIDGVFVPNGKAVQTVSSKGDVFKECPPTSGFSFNSIMNSSRTVVINWNDKGSRPISEIAVLKCLIMHANSGITFDLDTIRKSLPQGKVVSFQARYGIEKGVPRPKASHAGFWVLLDGVVKFSAPNVRDLDLHSIAVDISDSDKFLTLVTTDGGDPMERDIDGDVVNPIDCDWCMFADPVLNLE